MKLKEAFVVLGNTDRYCDYMMGDVLDREDVFYYNKLHYMGKLRTKLFTLKTLIVRTKKAREISYKYRFDKKVLNKADTVHFVIFDTNSNSFNEKFFIWAKKKCKNCTFSLVLINSLLEYKDKADEKIELIKKLYQNVYTIDKKNAQEQGYNFIEGLYSKPKNISTDITSDVYLIIGKVKNRYDDIVFSTSKLLKMGLNCNFNVNKMENATKGIKTDFVPYDQVVKDTQSTKIILDIGCKGQLALPLRAMEAIVYNKAIITNSEGLMESKFYNENYIVFLNDENFEEKVKKLLNEKVDYGYKDEYSPKYILRDISAKHAERNSTK